MMPSRSTYSKRTDQLHNLIDGVAPPQKTIWNLRPPGHRRPSPPRISEPLLSSSPRSPAQIHSHVVWEHIPSPRARVLLPRVAAQVPRLAPGPSPRRLTWSCSPSSSPRQDHRRPHLVLRRIGSFRRRPGASPSSWPVSLPPKHPRPAPRPTRILARLAPRRTSVSKQQQQKLYSIVTSVSKQQQHIAPQQQTATEQ